MSLKKSPVLGDNEECVNQSRAHVLYFSVLHLILQTPFLNFPLWSCPALAHAQWRPQHSSHSLGAKEVPMSLTAAVDAVTCQRERQNPHLPRRVQTWRCWGFILFSVFCFSLAGRGICFKVLWRSCSALLRIQTLKSSCYKMMIQEMGM